MGLWGAAAGALSGISSIITQQTDRLDKISDYKYSLSTLEDSKKISDNTALSTFNNKKTDLNNSITAISMSIEDTTESRDTSLKTGANAAAGTSQVATLNYATLLGTVKNNEGTGLANAANSGFRMSDSALNTYAIAKTNGATSVQSFRLQTDLQNNSNYSSIAANYTNANNQIESYQFQKQVNEESLQTVKDQYKTSKALSDAVYKTKKSYISNQVNYLENEGKWSSIGTGILNLAGQTIMGYGTSII